MIVSQTDTPAAALWPHREMGHARNVAVVLFGTALLWLSAKVQVPFWPVPLTMQTFVVLALGAVLGSRLGALTVMAYLAEGALGLPVFAGTPEKGLGLAYMIGPTGGYLTGFVLAAFLSGWLAERKYDRTIPKMFMVAGVGHAVIFLCGWVWLTTLIGPEKAWMAGVAPFYLATILKCSLAALLLPAIWRTLKN